MRESKAVKVLLWVAFAIFMLYILTLMVPLYYLILNSLKRNSDFINNQWGCHGTFDDASRADGLYGKQFADLAGGRGFHVDGERRCADDGDRKLLEFGTGDGRGR